MDKKPSAGRTAGTATDEGEMVARRAARIRLALIVGAVLAVGGFVLAILLALREESVHERWDTLEELRTQYEPAQDPIWENPYGVYNAEREQYIAALEKFLDTRAKEEDDALEPHTRFMIAKTVADHILSNPGRLDAEARAKWYRKGVEQLEAIRDQFPDFPLNWTSLSSEGYPTLTRQFLHWLNENEKWEREYLPRPRDPDPDVRVLLRTERGDMLMGLFTQAAPAWTSAFLDRAVRGYYDGTSFMAKEEVGDATAPERFFVRAGGESTRTAEAFDADGHRAIAEKDVRADILPEEARNLIPHDRGIVSVWHDIVDEYDTATELLVVTSRSPMLDYRYTPVGKLLEEDGYESLRVLDRINGGLTWREDDTVRNNTELSGVLDYLQAPVKIVKVLVYRNGKLQEPSEGALETRASIEETERGLGTVERDRYRVEPPVKPSSPDGPPEDGGKEGDEDAGAPEDDAPEEQDAGDEPDAPDAPEDDGE